MFALSCSATRVLYAHVWSRGVRRFGVYGRQRRELGVTLGGGFTTVTAHVTDVIQLHVNLSEII